LLNQDNYYIKKYQARVELDRFVKKVILTPVANGTIHICRDYIVAVNPYLKDQYSLTIIENLYSNISGSVI